MAATANVFALLGDGDDDIQQLAAKAAIAVPAPVKAPAADAGKKAAAPKAEAGACTLSGRLQLMRGFDTFCFVTVYSQA